MTNLISGKEALIALGSSKEVEYKSIDGWGDASLIHAFEFLDNNYEFRLKPRTISINNIEVLATPANITTGTASTVSTYIRRFRRP